MSLRSLWKSGGTYTRPALGVIALTWLMIGSGQCEGTCDSKDHGVEVQSKCEDTAKAVDGCLHVVRE